MTKFSSKTIIAGSVIPFLIIALIYCFAATKIYTSKSQVALFRLKIEDPGSNMEESRNRWIWIRDGLNLKSALFTETLLDNLIAKNALVKAEADRYPNKRLAYEHFHKLINIQFTGADENNYLVEVKAANPQIAYELNLAVFERLKYLAVIADQKKFDAVIAEIRLKQQELKDNRDTFDFYNDKIKKLTFSNIVEQKQKETAFEIITSPTLNEIPVWPNSQIILIIAGFIGLIFGMALDYVISSFKKCKKE